MAQDTTKNGKAFEFACLEALRVSLGAFQRVCVNNSAPFWTAKKCYESIDAEMQKEMHLAAMAMKRVLVRLEPKLENCRDGDVLTLSLQSDMRGQAGDVRDVLCMRVGDKWEIGLSCKHNHAAVKHSRLGTDLDFGKKWVGCPCSSTYFARTNPIFLSLEKLRSNARQLGKQIEWNELPDKEDRVYVPILNAFIDEIKRIDSVLDGELAPRLVHYLLGEKDFYKVIADASSRSTRIEAFNITGTLGESFEGVKSLYGRQKLKLPTRIIEIRYKSGSKNTIELTCDKGWQFSLRIHNASKEIEPSLKFDIQLVSKLSSHASVNIDEPWDFHHDAMTVSPFNVVFDEIPNMFKFREYLPLYSLRAVCGPFAEGRPVEPEGWVKVEGKGVLDDTQFVVKTEGASMEGLIEEGAYVILRKIGGDLEGKVLLVQRFEEGDPENGGAYTIKKFTKKGSKVVLKARNPEVADIVLEDDAEYSTRYRAIAEFKGVIP